MREIITSPNNPRIKYAVSMRDERKRKKAKKIIVDGWREIAMACRRGLVFEYLFVATSRDAPAHEVPIPETVEHRAVIVNSISHHQIVEVEASIMRKIEFGNRQSGAVAIIESPQLDLDAIPTVDNGLYVVLDQIEKPGNLGAIIRTANAAGASAVILSDPICDPFNPNVIRASQGGVFHMPLASSDAASVLTWLRARDIQMLAARVEGSRTYTDIDLRRASAFVLGNEDAGLAGGWSAVDVIPIRIPMYGQVDSLNVSVTAGILLFAAARERSEE